MKIVASLTISVALIAAAVILYYYANRNDSIQNHYRDSVSIARQIQQLDTSWSMETTRVESDPLSDFDSLAAFIPKMDRLKDELTDAIRQIPDVPNQISNDISSYVSTVDAKEERIERFKTSYAVIRNSVRYLPLAATNLIRVAEEANDRRLAQDTARLTQDIIAFLVTQTEPDEERLGNELAALRDRSVTYPPNIANALANFVAHADVLVARKVATETIFQEATAADISERTERLVSAFEFEAGRAAQQAQRYELGIFGTLAALVLLWGMMAVFRFVETPARPRAPAHGDPTAFAAPQAAIATDGGARVGQERASANGPLPQAAGSSAAVGSPSPELQLNATGDALSGVATDLTGHTPSSSSGLVSDVVEPISATASTTTVAEFAPPPTNSPQWMVRNALETPVFEAKTVPSALSGARPTPEAKALHRIVTGFISNSLASYVHQLTARLDHLHQSQDRIRNAVGPGDGISIAPGVDFDEEIETSFAVLSSIRRQIDDISALAGRLASFSRQRDGEIGYELINIEGCVNEACDAVQADSSATVTKNFGQVPDIFASKFDVLLLLEYILENAVCSVQALRGREGIIKIDVTQRNNEILVTVVDNGDGFEADQRGKIFEPFYTTREHALGIGLPSAVYLASKYRGTISANSLPGEGTVFRITLPAGVTGETTI